MTQPPPDPNAMPGPDPSLDVATAPTAADRDRTFEQRMERFGQEAEEAGKRIGQQAEAAGKRLAADPAVASAADSAARVWGLLVLAAGVWFFADITLDMDMPSIAWRELWPLALILVGAVIVFRGVVRRRA